jgi:hypothetical protein
MGLRQLAVLVLQVVVSTTPIRKLLPDLFGVIRGAEELIQFLALR